MTTPAAVECLTAVLGLGYMSPPQRGTPWLIQESPSLREIRSGDTGIDFAGKACDPSRSGFLMSDPPPSVPRRTISLWLSRRVSGRERTKGSSML